MVHAFIDLHSDQRFSPAVPHWAMCFCQLMLNSLLVGRWCAPTPVGPALTLGDWGLFTPELPAPLFRWSTAVRFLLRPRCLCVVASPEVTGGSGGMFSDTISIACTGLS